MAMNWRRKRRLKKVKPGDGSALGRYRLWQLLSRTLFYIDLPRPAQPAPGSAAGAPRPMPPGPGNVETVPGDESPGVPHSYAVDVHFFADDIGDYSLDAALDGVGDLLGLSKKSEEGNEARKNAEGKRKPQAPAALYRDGEQILRSNLPAVFRVPEGVIEVEASLYGLSRMHYVRDDGAEYVLQPDRRTAEGLRARFGRRFPGLNKVIGAVAILILLVGLAVAIPQVVELITGIEFVAERVGSFTSPIKLPDWVNTTLLVAGIVAALERALTLRNHWLIDMDTTWWSFG
ncbi:hypothetical protein VR010_04285 [Actinomycetaceae bacterium L2_0104]